MLQVPESKGIYIIAFRLEKRVRLRVGKLGEIEYYPGIYFYCGSAKSKGGLHKRIERHQNKDTIKFWHIDHFKTAAVVLRIWLLEIVERSECVLVRILGSSPSISTISPGFGSSDCREKCGSHLLFATSDTKLDLVYQLLMQSLPEIKQCIAEPEQFLR